MSADKGRLIELLAKRSYREGDFRLSSDQPALYYIDAKTSTLSGEAVEIIANLILDLVVQDEAQAVGGMTLGADPLAAAVTLVAHQRGMDVAGFIVRKEPKKHGTQKYIEGPDISGKRVIVVDDVVTTGGSIRDACVRVRETGADVTRLVSVVHRGPGEKTSVLPRDVEYSPIIDVEEIIEFSKHVHSTTT